MLMLQPSYSSRFLRFELSPDYIPWAVIVSMIIAAVISLNFQGRVWWCPAGDAMPWSFDIWSQHNSQHVIDPYSFTHILHGIIEFWLIGLIFSKMPMMWRLVLALFIETTWEVVENTNYVINRYREATLSLNYVGDSIINSVADIVCCGLGFAIAYRVRFVLSLALFAATEAILLLTIRDSLVVNIIMLIYPIEAIKQWQTAGM